ncbi:PAP fibrillin [Calothrix sp. FACHB-1219]|uniref:PAP/fibrillin family protein n=1 Tax=unclassified Calothrix TaxID=2619626 RepID=UPI00168A3D13|nr:MULTISPECIES: PAP/fibrillin family protein [unclassified Calothrix]MBD2206340.1 PAP fibrillin [Calothrix sp. FACHB-168]MBD2221122.1 PAP fibrillin [Calothrix sp. FACHB-1219]
MNAAATRLSLKNELLQRIGELGLQQSIFPSADETCDRLVQQLENINPCDRPLSIDHLSTLSGDWELIYASRGTVVTRRLVSLRGIGARVKIKRVWQKLVASQTNQIFAANCAEFDLPLLGEWRLQADGVWRWDRDERDAKVSFGAFSVQATKLLGISNWSLPALKIPVLESMRKEALWTTSYLDSQIRVGRGATGNLFVFRRQEAMFN